MGVFGTMVLTKNVIYYERMQLRRPGTQQRLHLAQHGLSEDNVSVQLGTMLVEYSKGKGMSNQQL